MRVIGRPDRYRPEQRLNQQAAANFVVLAAQARAVTPRDADGPAQTAGTAETCKTLANCASDGCLRTPSQTAGTAETPAAAQIRRSKLQEASANCGNALIGESVEKWAPDGGRCLPSLIALIAAMSRPCESACRPARGSSKSDSEKSVIARIHSATN